MNRAESFKRFTVKPITGALGAEIFGVDLGAKPDAPVIEDLKRALNDYHVLAVRDQTMTLDSFHRLRECLGAFSGNPVHESIAGYDDIMLLSREPDDSGKVIGEDWHMDLAWLPKPPGATVLYGEVVPPFGGDTCFTSLELAYKALSPGMKALIDPLVAVHSGKGVLAAQYGSVKVRADADKIASFEVEHPLVCIHPTTGRRYLFVSSVIERFKGLTPAESRPIADYLFALATRPEFNCRLRWRQGTVGMWLNPCVLHTAINDYSGFRRTMYRTTIEGWAPVAASAQNPGAAASRAA
jgi:alpha-ketoglutarate-dependent taurine dioxygenase